MERGVLVAADEEISWILPWWWERYSSFNTLPVAFVDFGMDKKTLEWCKKRGEVIPFTEEIKEETLSKSVIDEWKKSYGESYEKVRQSWFKKPTACFLTPFEKTVWIDLDCEVLSNIEDIFSFLSEKKELSIAFEPKNSMLFNGGVIVFQKGSSLIEEWKALAKSDRDKYWGDDRVLSKVIEDSLEKVTFLPEIYNWRVSQGIPLSAKIIHWCGEPGKNCIREYGGLEKLLKHNPELKDVLGVR